MIHLLMDNLTQFHILAVVNTTTVNMNVYVFAGEISFGYVSKSGVLITGLTVVTKSLTKQFNQEALC